MMAGWKRSRDARLERMMSRNGYDFQPVASIAGVLAFMKLEEVPDDGKPAGR